MVRKWRINCYVGAGTKGEQIVIDIISRSGTIMLFRLGKGKWAFPNWDNELGCFFRRNRIMRKTFALVGLVGLDGRATIPALFAVALTCLFGFSSANAGIVAYWTIPTANVAGQAATAVPQANWSAASISGTIASYPTGTTVNDPRGTPSATSGIRVSSGSTFQFSLTRNTGGASLYDFVITYAATRGNIAGTTTSTWQYSLNGTTWSSTGVIQPATVPAGTTWNTYTVDFTGVTSIENVAVGTTIYFRDTIGSNNQSFDNIVISAVPEPITYALAAFGLMFAGVGAGRFYLGRRGSATVS
jgi:hypothetical protein